MEMNKYAEGIIRIPLSIFYRGRKYIGEVTGRTEPLRRFSFRMPGGNVLEIEAIGSKPCGGYIWSPRKGHELGSYVSYIGRQIEKYLGSKVL